METCEAPNVTGTEENNYKRKGHFLNQVSLIGNMFDIFGRKFREVTHFSFRKDFYGPSDSPLVNTLEIKYEGIAVYRDYEFEHQYTGGGKVYIPGEWENHLNNLADLAGLALRKRQEDVSDFLDHKLPRELQSALHI
ncbi:hypothetical protein HYW74_05165 [Candidatus Pacearchaeota archaeon]|nr:hypothetical protein [Candidatus Pacearchaeota archaeon]